MNIAYNILIGIFKNILLPTLSIFSDKIKSFLLVRVNLLGKIGKEIDITKKHIWIHVSSLGELSLIHI